MLPTFPEPFWKGLENDDCSLTLQGTHSSDSCAPCRTAVCANYHCSHAIFHHHNLLSTCQANYVAITTAAGWHTAECNRHTGQLDVKLGKLQTVGLQLPLSTNEPAVRCRSVSHRLVSATLNGNLTLHRSTNSRLAGKMFFF